MTLADQPAYSFAELPGWDFRQGATAAMLNPALVATVVAGAAERFLDTSGEPLPWEYAFIIAPLVFHKASRRALPTRINSHLSKWIKDNPILVAGFGDRSRAMGPFVREGLRFGLRTGALTLDDEGRLIGKLQTSKAIRQSTELAELVQRSGFVGSWLTKLDRPATVFAFFGVAP